MIILHYFNVFFFIFWEYFENFGSLGLGSEIATEDKQQLN